MELTDYEKTVYKALLYRKIKNNDKLNEKEKRDLIEKTIDEAEKSYLKTFSFYLKSQLEKEIATLEEKDTKKYLLYTLSKKQINLITTLKALDKGTISLEKTKYKNNKIFNTILNQVLQELNEDKEKEKAASILFPKIKDYLDSKRLRISITDINILKDIEKENTINLNDDIIKNDLKITPEKFHYKIKYLSHKIKKDELDIKDLFPKSYLYLNLIAKNLTLKEIDILKYLNDEIKEENLNYHNKRSYKTALQKLYQKIKENKDLQVLTSIIYKDIIPDIEKREIKQLRIRIRQINNKHKNLFKRTLTVKKAPKIIRVENNYLPYTIIDSIKLNNYYLNNKGPYLNSRNITKENLEKELIITPINNTYSNLTISEKWILALRLGYIKSPLYSISALANHFNIEKKTITTLLHETSKKIQIIKKEG